jgi:DnaK suppressor protein
MTDVPRLRTEAELTQALKAEQERLRQQLALRDEAGRALGESQDQESSAGGDLADVGSDLGQQEVELSMADAERDRLLEVEAALIRIAEGRYGRCLRCDGSIPLERLRVLPWTSYCRECASRFGSEQPPSAISAGVGGHLQ